MTIMRFWTINWRRENKSIRCFLRHLWWYETVYEYYKCYSDWSLLIFYIRILQELWSGSWKEVCIIVKTLDSGWLSGKYTAESTFHDIRNRWSSKDIQTRAALVNRVNEITQAQDNLAQKQLFCLSSIRCCLDCYSRECEYKLTSNVEIILFQERLLKNSKTLSKWGEAA
jgi:hypothetical protein